MTTAKRWLVTGAAGFIGSNLCTHILRNGDDVVGYDNFLTGKQENIDRLQELNSAAFTFVEGDILDGNMLRDALDGANRMVHLAAQVSVQRSLDEPAETNEINATGFLTALTSAASAGVERFFYASSCAVYGDNPAPPLSEGSELRPLSPYAATKVINEHYAKSLAATHPDLKTVGLRLFNVFGPHQDRQGGYAAVIPCWIGLLIEGKQPVVYGDGSATRDFCFVGNVCDLIHALGARDAPSADQVYNVGTGNAVTLSQLYSTICSRLAAKGVKIAFESPKKMPWRAGDIVHSYADIQQIRDDLDYAPTVGLAEGIDRILEQEYGLT
jgi:UDP-N-acetylglucosamine 4-epimerase